MTRFALTDIPPSAQQSLEALVCWGLCTLQFLYPDTVALEGIDNSGSPIWVRSISANILPNTAISVNPDVPNDFKNPLNATPSEYRFMSRLSLRLPNSTFASNPWSSVGSLGDSTIPPAFKV